MALARIAIKKALARIKGAGPPFEAVVNVYNGKMYYLLYIGVASKQVLAAGPSNRPTKCRSLNPRCRQI